VKKGWGDQGKIGVRRKEKGWGTTGERACGEEKWEPPSFICVELGSKKLNPKSGRTGSAYQKRRDAHARRSS